MDYKYEPPYAIILCLIIIVNIISSTYFICIILAGIVFKIFTISLKQKYFYLSIFAIITFLNMETIYGLTFFSMTTVALTLNYIVIPKIKHLISSNILKEFICLLLFYLVVLVFNHITFDIALLKTMLLNFTIDSLIVGFIL
jgi:hypothetical protein